MADKRVEKEGSLVFLASDLSTASRQFNAMKPHGKKRLLCKKLDGMSKKDVKKPLVPCCLKMLHAVCFICYASGVGDMKTRRIAGRASAEGIKHNMGIH